MPVLRKINCTVKNDKNDRPAVELKTKPALLDFGKYSLLHLCFGFGRVIRGAQAIIHQETSLSARHLTMAAILSVAMTTVTIIIIVID